MIVRHIVVVISVVFIFIVYDTAKISEHGDIATMKSDETRNTSVQMIRF